jgi:hypothetical protein
LVPFLSINYLDYIYIYRNTLFGSFGPLFSSSGERPNGYFIITWHSLSIVSFSYLNLLHWNHWTKLDWNSLCLVHFQNCLWCPCPLFTEKQSTGRHVTPLLTYYPESPCSLSYRLSIWAANAKCFARLSWSSNPRSTTPKASMLTITPLMCLEFPFVILSMSIFILHVKISLFYF